MFVFAVSMPVCVVRLALLPHKVTNVCLCLPLFSPPDIIEGDPASEKGKLEERQLPEPSLWPSFVMATDVVIAS